VKGIWSKRVRSEQEKKDWREERTRKIIEMVNNMQKLRKLSEDINARFYARIHDNRSVPGSGSGDFDLHRQVGMGAPYELVDEPSDLRSYDLPAVLGNDVEIRSDMTKSEGGSWEEMHRRRLRQRFHELKERQIAEDRFWSDFWKQFWKMFWFAIVVVVILGVVLALL